MVTRYYAPDDPNIYVTPSRLKRLGHKKKVAYMVEWFRNQFCDPAEETPFNSREGGYLYIWGGPYSADDELRREFEGIVSERAISDAIKDVESDGIFDWAPGYNHPNQVARREEELVNYETPAVPSLEDIRKRLNSGARSDFGDSQEHEERRVLRKEIAQLLELLAAQQPRHGRIGHNQPPEEMAIEEDMATKLKNDIVIMDQELAKPEPNVSEIVERTGSLQRIIAWGAEKADMAVDTFVKRLGDLTAVGVAGTVVAVAGSWQAVWSKISAVAQSALNWLNTVTLPF